MSSLFTPDETKFLISIWDNETIQKKLNSTRNRFTWIKIVEAMTEAGYKKNLDQIKEKIRNLTRKFYSEKKKVDVSGKEATNWEFFHEMNEVLGDSALANPRSIVDSSETRNSESRESSFLDKPQDLDSDFQIMSSPDDKVETDLADGGTLESTDNQTCECVDIEKEQDEDAKEITEKQNAMKRQRNKSERVVPPKVRRRGKQPDRFSTMLQEFREMQEATDKKFFDNEEKRYKAELEAQKVRATLDMERETRQQQFLLNLAQVLQGASQTPVLSSPLQPSSYTSCLPSSSSTNYSNLTTTSPLFADFRYSSDQQYTGNEVPKEKW